MSPPSSLEAREQATRERPASRESAGYLENDVWRKSET
jgi:hypothetical protein